MGNTFSCNRSPKNCGLNKWEFFFFHEIWSWKVGNSRQMLRSPVNTLPSLCLLRTWTTWRWTVNFESHCCLPVALTLYLVAGKRPSGALSWQLRLQWPLWLPDMDGSLCWLLALFLWLELLITWGWVPRRGRPDGQAPVCKHLSSLY